MAAGIQGCIHILEYFAAWRLYVGLTVHKMRESVIWAESFVVKYHYHQGLLRTCYPCVRACTVISSSPYHHHQHKEDSEREGWQDRLVGATWVEGWGAGLLFPSPLFCTSAPSCLLLFLHKLSHSLVAGYKADPEFSLFSCLHHDQEL